MNNNDGRPGGLPMNEACEQSSPTVGIPDALSFDAKCIAGAWFGLMVPGKGDLTFELQNLAPSDRAQDALDELVSAGIISVEPFNRYGGLTYRPLVDCRWGFDFLRKNMDNSEIKWPITRKLVKGEAMGVQKRALMAAQGIEARQGQDGNRPDRNDESPVACDAPIPPIEGTSHAD